MPKNDIKIGLVKWFDRNNGFGIIETSEKEEYFLHASNIELSDDRILIATPLIFEIGKAKEGKTTPAINCRIPSAKEDFNVGLSLIGKHRKLEFEVKVRYKSSWGNPYSKRVKRTYDILDYFWHKVLSNLSKNDITDLFKKSFESNVQSWNSDEIIDFYRITKDRIHSLKLDISEFELSEDETTRIDPNHTCQFKLTRELIDFYNSLISDRVKVVLWKCGELSQYRHHYHFDIFDEKSDLPFDENLLLTHADVINPEDFDTINKFKISQSVLNTLIDNVYNRIFAQTLINYDDLRTQILYFEELSPSNQRKYFENILSKIPEELLFEIWHERTISVDYENKVFKLYCPSSFDYKIPIVLLEKYVKALDSSILKRIIKIFDDFDVARFILNKYDDNLIDEKNIIEVIKSIEDLSEEQQVHVIEKIFNDLFTNYLEQLLENNLLQIKNRSTGKILSYEFKIDNEYAKLIIDAIANVYRIPIEDKISAIQTLEPESSEENIIKLIPKAANHELFVIHKMIPKANTFKHIQESWLFFLITETYPLIKIAVDNDYIIEDDFWSRLYNETQDIPMEYHLKILKYFANDITINQCIKSLDLNEPEDIKKFLEIVDLTEKNKDTFLNRFHANSESISISNLISLVGVFHIWGLPFKAEDFKKRLNESIGEDEFIALIRYFSEIDDELKLEFEDSILNYINKNINENDPLIEECIPIVRSTNILKTFINKCTVVNDPNIHLKNLKSSEYLNSLPLDFMEEHLSQFLSSIPIQTLELVLDIFPDLYNKFADKVFLDKSSFIAYLKLLNEKFDIINKVSEGDHDLHVVCQHYSDLTNAEFLIRLHQIFEKNYYSSQIDYVKFLCFQYYKQRLNKDELLTLLDRIKFIQLSALLIYQFISKEIKSRDELMDCMNSNLKDHFRLLLNTDFTEETLLNIFTLDDLVKSCSGRKKWTGLRYWKHDKLVRWYTDGNHRLKKQGYENIFCEGRFWQKQPFYFSNNKQPTAEKYDFFWCKDDYCAKVNDSVDLNDDFETWTLNEINEIFGINLDRLSFTYVAGWMNRMKSIFDRLKCEECGHFLRPKHYVPKKLGYYAVPLFQCINEKCSLNSVEIRFTHCIGCGKILDSRECKTCKTCNWLICDDENCNRCGCGADHKSIYVQYE